MENYSYEEALEVYGIDYDMVNPVTCMQAFE